MTDTTQGYIFPRVPGKWSDEERRFALALQPLFDTLYYRVRKLESAVTTLKAGHETNSTAISGLEEDVDDIQEAVEALQEDMAAAQEAIEELQSEVNDDV